jgi:hypothetical protein
MMDGNNVYILESMFDGGDGYFKGIMEWVYRGDVGCGSGTSCDDNNGRNIPASSSNIIVERVVFGLFGGNSVKRESVIAVGEFNVLNENIGWGLVRWIMVIWDTSNTQYIRFKSCSTMTPGTLTDAG